MANADVGATSFEFYEGIRIVVPGAISVALYAALACTFGFDEAVPASDALVAIAAVLGVGLALLYIDAPARSAAYFYDLPSRELSRWGVAPPRHFNMENVYFAILDELMPNALSRRVLYMGSMFRIGFEAIYLLGATSVVVLTLGGLAGFDSVSRTPTGAATVVLVTVAVLHVVAFGVSLVLRYRSLTRYFVTRDRPVLAAWHELRAEVGRLERVTMAASAIAAGIYFWRSSWPIAAAAIAGPGLLWAYRQFDGYPATRYPFERPEWRSSAGTPASAERLRMRFGGFRTRAPVRVGSVALYGWTAGLACVVAAAAMGKTSPLGDGYTVAWAGASLATSVLIIARGHERKLYATYRSQRLWLRLNRATIEEKYFGSERESPTESWRLGLGRFSIIISRGPQVR